ncbi:MAG: bifunctional riboflavin kinase/FAD synthetase [Rhodobacteraceae bacterium]|nr:bifunctional riboflavin kinase/FAD synthetase [Paracoccaceae bacterium]
MQIVQACHSSEAGNRGAAVAIGNFDGVHVGHQSVIRLARQQADRLDAPLGVLTFEPHPRQYFNPTGTPFRLMSADAKARRLARMGVDILYQLPFDDRLAELSHQAFEADILVRGLGISGAVAGADFRYGKDRGGTVHSLSASGKSHGFEVDIAPIAEAGDKALSSSRIRAALTEGDVRMAADILGHWHRIEGRVTRGEMRGRELGFPTANIDLSDLHPPKFGVYSVQTDILTGTEKGRYPGVASIGVRPTFGENPLNLEVFLFGLDAEIYGEVISVALVGFQRPELEFSDAQALIEQMRQDCVEAKSILENLQ